MIQNTTLEPKGIYEVPKSCFTGYIKNANSESVDIYISGNSAGFYKETLAPNTVLHLKNTEYSKIYNLSGLYKIDIVYCSANEQIEFLNGQVQIGNASVTIDGNVQVSSGTVDF